jgi:penicillin-binding protein 1A
MTTPADTASSPDHAPRGLARRPWWRRASRAGLRIALVLVLAIPLFAAAASGSAIGALLFGVPGVGDLPGTVPDAREPLRAQPSVIYDGYGVEIGQFRQFDLSLPLTPEVIPQVMKDALVAGEDHTFYTHKGLDPQGLLRAAQANLTEGEVVQGGSTITQQLVREKYLSNERTFGRKFNEVLLAARLERDLARELGSERAAKDQIMFEYLDSVYFGAGAYGLSAAAQTYFKKQPQDLTASEAATLVGVIPAPSKYGPRDDLGAAEDRRRAVLKEMRDLNMLTDDQLVDELGRTLFNVGFGPPPGPATIIYPPPQPEATKFPYFVDYVRRYLLDKYGPEMVYRGGLQIYTSIDPGLQDQAEQAVAQGLGNTAAPLEMSLVTVEPATGQVKAFVGGRDWNASQVNLGLGGTFGMQPGSTFKAYTVAKALEDGYRPDTRYNAPGVFRVPGCGGTCSIKGGSGGVITMEQATANSVNTYFAQLVLDLGPNRVAELANRLGVEHITLDKEYNLGLTLGAFEVSPLEMAAGFSVFANHGVKPGATPIAKLVGPDGTVIEDNTVPHGERVLSAGAADWTTKLLTGVINGGTGKRANIGRPAAGKTGTAEAYRAAWFVGYTPQLSTAVWMGYADTPRPLRNINGVSSVFGGTIPAATWQRFMKAAHADKPIEQFAVPGPLPAPNTKIRRLPEGADEDFGALAQDCGGPCVVVPTLTTPTTRPPECDNLDPDAEVPDVCLDPKDKPDQRPLTGAPTTTFTVPDAADRRSP